MKPLLKQYLAWGIVVLFVAAAAVDFGGLFFREGFEGSGFKVPQFTVFILSIRHWAFALPMAMLFLTIALYSRVRSEGILLHRFGIMMFSAIVIVTIVSAAIMLPMFASSAFRGGME